MRSPRLHTAKGFDRLVNYSDAVVAIAITLLVLPLMDLGTEARTKPALELMQGHWLELSAFFGTFFVMTIFWINHHGLFELVGDYDAGLLWLNSAWLVGIVLFPFTSELISSGGFNDGAGVMYCMTMAALSAVQGWVTLHVRSRPGLWAPSVRLGDFHPGWSWVYAAYFTAVALLSIPLPDLASWTMLGLIPLGQLKASRTQDPHSQPE